MYTERLAPLLIRPRPGRSRPEIGQPCTVADKPRCQGCWRDGPLAPSVHGRAGHRAPARRGRPPLRPGKPHPQRPDHHRRVLPQARRPRPGLPARRWRLPRRDRIRSRRLRPRAPLHRRRSQLRRPGRGQPGSHNDRIGVAPAPLPELPPTTHIGSTCVLSPLRNYARDTAWLVSRRLSRPFPVQLREAA
jgi:hypothetical protein